MSARTGRDCRATVGARAAFVWVLTLTWGAAADLYGQTSPAPADSQTPPPYIETVEVVGATPVGGVGVPRDKIPSHVQTATAADLARAGGLHAGEQLPAAFASVHVNEAQGNPFQPDLQFRGFAASPLLGLPQGVAVYQDGVRLNEVFGDTVHWNLLPTAAIAGITVMPGSNPLFGLNALGGAVSVQTKTGFSHPGHAVSLFGGSFGRGWADLQSAGHSAHLSYFVTGRVLREDGWRNFSPSRVRQAFGQVDWRTAATTLSASLTAGADRLIGNGAAPVQLLGEDRAAIFTHPDETRTDMALLTLRARHTLARGVTLDAVLSYRPSTIRSLNGDDTAYGPCAIAALLCADEGDGDPVVDQFGRTVPLAAEALDGTDNTSVTRSRGWGASTQIAVTRRVAGRDNHAVAGVSLDAGRSRYQADTELARLTDDRGTVGSGIVDAGAAVRLHTQVRHAGFYLADFFTLAPRVTLMGAARVTHSRVELRDQLGDDLTGDHEFTRVNPSTGITFAVSPQATLYGSVGVSSRVPTPSELGCADPEDPCRLPNAFVADPPLEQVVATTWEGGARGRLAGWQWTASVFRTKNRDDIIFISSGALTREGHFENIGATLRRGLEFSGSGAIGSWISASAAYTYLRATFETPLTLSSPHHPEGVGGEIRVTPGDTIPTVPRHNLKGNLAVTAGRLVLSGTVMATSSQFLRGDEANLLAPIGRATITNLSGSYPLHRRARAVARVTNLFNRRVATFGLLGDADDVLGDAYDDPRFLSPGAPRAAWLGLELSF